MKKRIGLLGSILLGAAMVTVGLSGDFAWAGDKGDKSYKSDKGGDLGDKGGDKGKGYPVPEPSSVILLGAAAVGLGIWSWRRKSTES